MKEPDTFLTNPVAATTPRPYGAAKDNPGDNTGSGMVAEIYNDPIYGMLVPINKYREGGISGNDESSSNPDFQDALEEMIDKKVDGVSDWSSSTTYSTLGTLVMYKGLQYVNYNNTGNTNKIPSPGSAYWYLVPGSRELMESYQAGKVYDGGMHPLNDRADALYQTLIEFGNYRLGENGDDYYDFFKIALDGTTVTGDADLVAALDVGGADEHPYLDIFAPDVLGTRTLLDMGEYALVSQSDGGESDTVGDLQLDRFQGHYHDYQSYSTGGAIVVKTIKAADGNTENTAGTGDPVVSPITDGVNGTPRTGLTTRGKQFVNGASYFISMIPA